MIQPDTIEQLAAAMRDSVRKDEHVLVELLADARALKHSTRRIQPRSATAISLVGTDGGDNKIAFDPFLVHVVRVVDSSNRQYCLEILTPTTDFADLNAAHIAPDGRGLTPMGRLVETMRALRPGVRGIEDLSPVFNMDPDKRSASWIQVYRQITEWAVLLDLLRDRNFATDTVIVCDGFLRFKMFKDGLFGLYAQEVDRLITLQFEKSRRRIYVVGVAKRTKLLQKYRLAMAVEGVLRSAYPAYVPLSDDFQRKVYEWDEFFTGGGKGESFAAGQTYFAKFGSSPFAPIWAVDILRSQATDAPTIFGYLLADCVDGFPVPYYPQCLQRAHESAALVDFDMDILQDQVSSALRELLGKRGTIIDELAMQETDPAAARYS